MKSDPMDNPVGFHSWINLAMYDGGVGVEYMKCKKREKMGPPWT